MPFLVSINSNRNVTIIVILIYLIVFHLKMEHGFFPPSLAKWNLLNDLSIVLFSMSRLDYGILSDTKSVRYAIN